jgi:hypothetical protein
MNAFELPFHAVEQPRIGIELTAQRTYFTADRFGSLPTRSLEAADERRESHSVG